MSATADSYSRSKSKINIKANISLKKGMPNVTVSFMATIDAKIRQKRDSAYSRRPPSYFAKSFVCDTNKYEHNRRPQTEKFRLYVLMKTTLSCHEKTKQEQKKKMC